MYATKTVSSQTTSAWIPMDDNQAAFNASVAVTVSGTLTYSVEFTLDNVQDPTITPTAFSTTLTGATTSQSLAVHYPVKAFRLNVTAFTSGSAIITVLQGSSWDGVGTVENSLYKLAPIPGFVPCLLASLVASSTAACTSGVVTVTATGHGIASGAAYTDANFYYPGSSSLAAGWYSNYARIDTNTISFFAPGAADFTSESVNGGAAFVDEVTVCSITLEANTLVPGAYLEIPFFRSSSSVAGTKTHKLKIGSSTLVTIANASTTLVMGLSSIGALISATGKALGHTSQIGTLAGTTTPVTFDPTVPQTLSITHQLSAASMFLFAAFSSLRVS